MSPALQTKLLCTSAELSALRPEWLDLHRRAGGWAAQHPAYVLAAQEVAPAGRSLSVITLWRGGRLSAVWPLSLSRRGRTRYATHPGCGSDEEYADALLSPEEDAAALARQLVAAAQANCDVVTLHNVEASSPLLSALNEMARARLTWSTDCHVVDLAGLESWEAWLKGKSKNFRQGLGGQRRNLAKLGELSSVQQEPQILPWFFEQKRAWLRGAGLRAAWIDDPAKGEAFFEALARQEATPLHTFALRLNGDYIAAGVCVESPRRLEYIATVYLQRSDVARYSPGMLVSEDCGRFALAHGMDLDFRVMDVPYKERWRSRIDTFESITAALTPRGVAPVLVASARRKARGLRRAAGRIVRAGLRAGPLRAQAQSPATPS